MVCDNRWSQFVLQSMCAVPTYVRHVYVNFVPCECVCAGMIKLWSSMVFHTGDSSRMR